MQINKKKNAVYGTIFGVLLKVTQIVFPFIIRTIFIRALGIEYLGLNSLFTSILQVLNLAELGVSSALVFSMYEPIAHENAEKICQLLNLYKKYYRIIGTVILLLGLALLPFLKHLVKGNIPKDVNIYILYLMHLASTVLSYWLFAYRRSLFLAYQRNDIISIISLASYFASYMIQIVVLLTLKNYYVYLSVSIFTQIAVNVIVAIYSKRVYPGYDPAGTLPSDDVTAINKQVRYLFTAKVGGVVNHSADSIVISAFLGISILAIYQNYYYIISSIMAVFGIFFTACTAGVGNSLIINGHKQNLKLLYNLNHITFFGINICCSCFICACEPFMDLWVGDKYILDFSYVILFTAYLFAEEASRVLLMFKDAGGIWKHDRFRPLTAAAVNLILNVTLTKYIGLYGIILSTIFALLFVAFPWLVINTNKRLFDINIGRFLKYLLSYILVICTSCLFTYRICNLINLSNALLTVFSRIIVAGGFSTLFFLTAFRNCGENKYLLAQVKSIQKKLRH